MSKYMKEHDKRRCILQESNGNGNVPSIPTVPFEAVISRGGVTVAEAPCYMVDLGARPPKQFRIDRVFKSSNMHCLHKSGRGVYLNLLPGIFSRCVHS